MKIMENFGKAVKFGGIGLAGFDGLMIAFSGAAVAPAAAVGLIAADLGIVAVGYGIEKYEQKHP